MSNHNAELSDLHRRVVQVVLQVPATIDEGGDVNFQHPYLGELSIDLDGSKPEWMDLVWMINRRIETHSFDDLVRICNEVNLTPWPAVLTVDESNLIVSASVSLFVAAVGQMPEEGLLRGIIGQAVSVLEESIAAFELEIQKG